MIEIDLSTAIVLYSSVLAVLVGGLWMYTELTVRRPQQYLGKQFLWKCNICGLSYLDEEATRLSQCPRCSSYITPDQKIARDAAERETAAASAEADQESRRNPSKGKRRGQRHRGGRRRR